MEKAQGFAHVRASASQIGLATITVYLAGTTTLATIYQDEALTPLANPFTADADGYWSFYAADGTYDVRFSGTVSPAWTLGGLTLYGIPGTAPSYTFPTSLLANVGTPSAGVAKLLTDDARNLVLAQGSQFFDVAGRVFNVRAFGAVGDGAANDTTAVQAAITAAGAAGGEVYFPPGIYKVTDALTFGANARIRGAGPNQSVITTHALWAVAGAYLLTFSASPGNDYAQVSIQDLGLGLNNDAAFAGGISLAFGAIGRFRISNVVALNGSTRQINLSGPWFGVVEDTYCSGATGLYARVAPGANVAGALAVRCCSFSSCGTIGLDYAGTAGGPLVVESCVFDQCGTAASAGTGAVKIQADAGGASFAAAAVLKGVLITDCDGGFAVRCVEPLQSSARYSLEQVMVSGGTRTYGAIAESAVVGYRVDVVGCAFLDAATADLQFDAQVKGNILGTQATVAVYGASVTCFPEPSAPTINRTHTQKTELLDPASGNASLGVGSPPDYATGRHVAQLGPIDGADDTTAWYVGFLAALNAVAASRGTGLAFTIQRAAAGAEQTVEIRATFRDNAGGTGAGGDYASILLRKLAGVDQCEISFSLTRSAGFDREVLILDRANGANETALQVYAQVAGALTRVSTGGADSAGTGYRVLRIPN